MEAATDSPPLYRVWVARYHDWRPTRWDEAPPDSRVVEPVVEACLNWEEACAVLAGFNETMLAGDPSTAEQPGDPLWAVVTRVVLRREGDMTPGQPTASSAVDCPAFVRDQTTGESVA